MKRSLYITLGLTCAVLGAIGVVLPGLPTTPLILATSWFFYRSSPELQKRLLESWLGRYIRNYHKQGGMRTSTKVWAVVLMAAMVTCSVIFFIEGLVGQVAVSAAGLVGCLVVVFKVPNAKKV